ncbi:hypothetical protein BGZ91_000902 [Linnemannia elongata]|nr:hypothetical protein BGZ91_000902 [Linnemannia elongata]
MKISLSVAALGAILIASSAEAIRVCRTGWQDNNTCGYNCQNGDPIDGQWCRNFKSALTKNGANCWGECNASNGFQFWCSKSSMSPSETLAGLHWLSSLESNIRSEHFEHIWARNPALAFFGSSIASSSPTLSTAFPGMRSLVVGTWLKSRDSFLILHRLANLHDLECETFGLMDHRHPNRPQYLSWWPHLKEINIRKRVLMAIARALVLRCQELEVFRQQDDAEPIHLSQSVRVQRKFLLRIFDAIHHRIDAKLLIEEPFCL